MSFITVVGSERLLAVLANARFVGLVLETGDEVAAPEYQRVPVQFRPQPDQSITNVAGVDFPVATSPWGKVTDMAFLDEAGNLITGAPLLEAVDVVPRDQVVIPPGGIIVRFKKKIAS